MGRSLFVAGLALAAAACAQPSSAVVTAPSATAQAASAPPAATPSAAPEEQAKTDASGGATESGPLGQAPEAYRACHADADCVVVRVAGCCDNGRKVAVAASQADAYAKAGACAKEHPICPMFRVRDMRVARCDAQSHLCTMVQP